MSEFTRALQSVKSIEELLTLVQRKGPALCGCDKMFLYAPAGNERSDDHLNLQVEDEQALVAGVALELPLIIHDTARVKLAREVLDEIRSQGITSLALLPVIVRGTLCGVLELRFTSTFHRWRRQEIEKLYEITSALEALAEKLDSHCIEAGRKALSERPSNGSENHTELVSFVERDDQRLRRLASFGDLIFIATDKNLHVREVLGDTEKILGVSAIEMRRDPGIWRRIVYGRDHRKLTLAFARSELHEFKSEVRIIHAKTGAVRWVLVRAVPRFSSNRVFSGWDGFAVDISQRYENEQVLLTQQKRLEALYEVAGSVTLNIDPALVALRGLRSLLKATSSDSGFVSLINRDSGRLEIVASEGLSQSYVMQMDARINNHSLAQKATEVRHGFLIDDIQLDARAASDIAREEGLKATIVMPLLFEGQALGSLALFCHRSHRYRSEDFELVGAACNQIALAARQAEVFLAQRKQASSLAALYKLSHELSKQLSMREIAEQAFTVIQEEISCKRLWLGVVNERASHVAGIAGSGPGMRRHINDLQIELGVRQDFFDQAIREKRAIIIPQNTVLECGDLNRLLNRLKPGTFVIIPLVAIGQVVGILVVEPAVSSASFAEQKLALLNNMAGEIATVLLARRFEARMAEADKMRMAGLLSSGIAHNFNNLLQAVMGQASLIEMQSEPESRIAQSARTIVESANKGAALVKQLFSLSSQGSVAPKVTSMNQLLLDSQELYRSILGGRISMEYSLTKDAPEVVCDFGQVQQIITNVLLNAKDAIGTTSTGRVLVATRRVRLRSGEVDPEMAPGMYVRVDIEDNGVGMDRVQQARCFEPFFTTKNADVRTGIGLNGAGLGLSSAYSMMRQHDGIITVRSEPGKGSTFSLYFPAVIIRTAEGASESVGVRPETAMVRAFLYGFDEPSSLSMRTMLESLGVGVTPCHSLSSLLDDLRSHSRSKRITVLDVEAVGMDFPRFLRAVKAEFASMSVVAVCARMRRWTSIMGSYPFLRLVEKPLGLWSMSSALRRAVQEQQGTLSDQVEMRVTGQSDSLGGAPASGRLTKEHRPESK